MLRMLSDVVEARRGQTHLGTYFSTQSQARRIQALLSRFLSNFEHLNFTVCFEGEGLALDPNIGQQTISKPFLFLSRQVPYTRTCIALSNAVYHQYLQQTRAQVLFNLQLHHCLLTYLLCYLPANQRKARRTCSL